ncbi:PH domain-containing protein [Micrococcus luteus]|uniref:PH domain-containing protein n=1 Tax=Micrococcus luteus TaxID=1270 RepID=UPI003D15FB35
MAIGLVGSLTWIAQWPAPWGPLVQALMLLWVASLVLGPVIRWRTARFHVSADGVQVDSGLLSRRFESLPWDLVTSVDHRQPWAFQLLGITEGNHTAEVNRSRAGRLRGSSPSTSPETRALRWKDTTWVRTCTSPRHQRSVPSRASRRRCTATISISVTSRACVVKSGQARVTTTACASSSSSSTRYVRSWCTYTAPGCAW